MIMHFPPGSDSPSPGNKGQEAASSGAIQQIEVEDKREIIYDFKMLPMAMPPGRERGDTDNGPKGRSAIGWPNKVFCFPPAYYDPYPEGSISVSIPGHGVVEFDQVDQPPFTYMEMVNLRASDTDRW